MADSLKAEVPNAKKHIFDLTYNEFKKGCEKDDQVVQSKCLVILDHILDDSEQFGNGGLPSLTNLVKGQYIALHFKKGLNLMASGPEKFTLKVYDNITVLDLILLVSKQIKLSWEEISLLQDKELTEIKQIHYGKSLA